MPTSIDSLFEKFSSEKINISNRVVMSPMTRSMSPGHIPDDNVTEYYRKRAAGGVGLIITEGTCIDHPAANGFNDVPFISSEAQLNGWKNVTDAVHKEGGKIFTQLWHVGAIRRPGTQPDPAVPGYGPSGMAIPGKVTGHTMTQVDIDETIQAYVRSAINAKKAGFDGIEIHAAHGYLIDQFFWSGTNIRTDKYGGSVQNRSRFAIEIIENVRSAVGSEYPISLRWSQWKQQDYNANLASSPNELEDFLKPLCEASIDIIHTSTRRFWEPGFKDSSLTLAGWAKKLTGKPSIAVGCVGLDTEFMPKPGQKDFNSSGVANLDNLMQRLDDNEFDLVALGRALIANPEWANITKNGNTELLQAYSKEMLNKLN